MALHNAFVEDAAGYLIKLIGSEQVTRQIRIECKDLINKTNSYSGAPCVRNLFANLPELAMGEFFEELATCQGVRIERILSSDQPEPVLYDQERDEWICLLQGEARLWIAGEEVSLTAGDHCLIPARMPHRVLSTSREPPCLWLAVHLHAPDVCLPDA